MTYTRQQAGPNGSDRRDRPVYSSDRQHRRYARQAADLHQKASHKREMPNHVLGIPAQMTLVDGRLMSRRDANAYRRFMATVDVSRETDEEQHGQAIDQDL